MEQAIQQFKTDICNSISMGDKRQAICFLVSKVGQEAAIKIAQDCGLNSSYYFSKLKEEK